MSKPLIHQLKATKNENGTYKIEGYFNHSKTQSELNVVQNIIPEETAAQIIIAPSEIEKKFSFVFNSFSFSSDIINPGDMLEIVCKATKSQAKHAGITIKPTKYPPPYGQDKNRLKQIRTFNEEYVPTGIEAAFEISHLEIVRNINDASLFDISVELKYNLVSSQGHDFTTKGCDVIVDTVNTFSTQNLLTFCLFVNEFPPNTLPNPNPSRTLLFSKSAVPINEFMVGLGMGVVISNKDAATIDWNIIDTKSALIAFEK